MKKTVRAFRIPLSQQNLRKGCTKGFAANTIAFIMNSIAHTYTQKAPTKVGAFFILLPLGERYTKFLNFQRKKVLKKLNKIF